MKFRSAELSDLQSLNSISVKSKAYWGYPDSWMKNWSDVLTLDPAQLSEQNILVLEVESKIIGFCSIVEEVQNYEILHLWILPEYIGKGLGKKLLDQAISQFVKSNKPIVVEADPNAEIFYQRQGFVTFDKTESYPPGRFLPVMKRVNH
ncbi:MAG: GNAT family N-acetyltransferase [Bacteroidota bacterium]